MFTTQSPILNKAYFSYHRTVHYFSKIVRESNTRVSQLVCNYLNKTQVFRLKHSSMTWIVSQLLQENLAAVTVNNVVSKFINASHSQHISFSQK